MAMFRQYYLTCGADILVFYEIKDGKPILDVERINLLAIKRERQLSKLIVNYLGNLGSFVLGEETPEVKRLEELAYEVADNPRVERNVIVKENAPPCILTTFAKSLSDESNCLEDDSTSFSLISFGKGFSGIERRVPVQLIGSMEILDYHRTMRKPLCPDNMRFISEGYAFIRKEMGKK